jgi:hypothetical protein
MKKIKYIAGIWLLLLLVSMVSCESDESFLKENPETFYTVDNAFSTSAQVDQVLVSIYSHLRNLWANPDESGWIFVFRGNGTDMFDVPSIRRANTFNNYGVRNPDNGSFYVKWLCGLLNYLRLPGLRLLKNRMQWHRPDFSGLLLTEIWLNCLVVFQS